MRAAFHEALVAAVGASHVLTEPDERAGYEVDWTGRYRGTCSAVVRPASTAEVSRVVELCNELDVVIVPQAGNTGLVGGGVPRDQSTSATSRRPVIVLSTTRLDQVGPVDTSSMQVTAGAGVTLARWREQARAARLDTPIDFAARDSATVGGAIATNAGGSRVLRFGTMRQQVMGIEAVTADGAVVGSLAGLPKEAAGIHWPSLLAGSEGTMAVITAARLRCVPWYDHTATALVALSSHAAAVALVGLLRQQVPSLDAVEIIEPAALELVAAHIDRHPPVSTPKGGTYVVIDCADRVDPTDTLTNALQQADGLVDSAVTSDPVQRSRLIEFRDRITEAIAARSTDVGVPTFKLDVAVPVNALGELIAIAQRSADRDGCDLIAFGHLAEGNLHLNHIGTRDPADIAAAVLPEVARLGGTISAEHGIGSAKAPWMHLIRSEADLAAQHRIRLALDPNQILNPGVLRM